VTAGKCSQSHLWARDDPCRFSLGTGTRPYCGQWRFDIQKVGPLWGTI